VARGGGLTASRSFERHPPMADFPLLLDAPDRNWALHVESLIQKALGERGSVTLGLPGERLPSAPGAPRYVVTGIAVCNEPAEEMLTAIRAALVDYAVEERPAPMASTKIVVRPREG
jgi:hypothetical protein